MNTEFKDAQELAKAACDRVVSNNQSQYTCTTGYAFAAGTMQSLVAMLIDGSMTREQAYRRLQELAQE